MRIAMTHCERAEGFIPSGQVETATEFLFGGDKPLRSPSRFLTALVAVALAVSPLRADDAELTRTNPRFAAAFAPVADAAKKSIVRVTCDGEDRALGVVIDADGLILTKANDLSGTLRVRLADGSLHDGKLVASHRQHDLALIKIDVKNLEPMALTPSKKTAAGAWVLAPLPSGEVAGFGVVSVPTREIRYKGPIEDPGSSPYLGVALEATEGGVRITSIVPGTPAEKVGLMAGDVIRALGDKAIAGYDEFVATLAQHHPGETLEVRIRRAEIESIIAVILERRPLGSFRGEMQNRMGSELSSRRTGYSTILQHDAVIRPTDCGGPLVDLDGHVLGLNICRAGRTETWALPTEAINAVLPEMKRQAAKAK
jgi:serine protease Do